jgi:hypothetical protein
MKKVRRYGFVSAFFLLTLLPFFATITSLTFVTPVDEKRQLAPPPQWEWPLDGASFVKQTMGWFDDNFGLRSLLIRLKTQIDFSVFRTSDRVHIGSDGQLFYRSVMDVEKLGVEEQLRIHETDILTGIRAFNDALRARGMRLILIVNLLADRFVPEKLPKTVPHLPSPPRMDDFIAKVAAIRDLVFIDATAILKQEQTERPVFHKTDFHWNDPAAFGVARAIVERIAAMEGRSEPVWTHKLEIETKELSGGIASFMPLFFPPSENGLFVKKTWTDPPGLASSFKEGLYEYVGRVTTPNSNLLPTIVVVGDSFFDGMSRTGFQAYFRNMYRARWNGNLKLSDIAAALPPDTRYVVMQFIEVNQGALFGFADKADVALAVKQIAARTSALQYGQK